MFPARFRSRCVTRRFLGDSALVESLEGRLLLTPTLTLSFFQQSIWEATFSTTTGFVTRVDADTTQSVVVSLSNSDPSELSIPATVTIAAGQTSASFTARGVDDNLLDGVQHVTVTATATLHGISGGSFDATAERVIDVVDYEHILTKNTSITQMSYYGQTGFVRIERSNTDVDAPVTVTIHNSDRSELITPETVTIAAGAKTVDIPVQFLDNGKPDGTRLVYLTFRADGYQNGGAYITLVEPGTRTLDVGADGSAFNSDADAEFESVDTTSGTIKIQEDYRGLFEFDASAYAGRQIDAVALTLDPWSTRYAQGAIFSFDVYAYSGDGVITVADATKMWAKVGDFSIDPATEYFGASRRQTILLDAATIRSYLLPSPWIGFVIVFTGGAGSEYSVTSKEAVNRPAYEYPQLQFFLQNDAPVMASPEYTFSVVENSPYLTSIGSVSASDSNSGDAIRYSIVGGNVGSAFAINQTTGAISVYSTGALDYETKQQWVLTVRATDDGRGTLYDEATVTINLIDEIAPQVVKAEVGYGENELWANISELEGRTAPWQINKIRITFSQAADVDVNDLKINATGTTLSFSSFAYDATNFVAVWTLASPLEADRLSITLDGDGTVADNQNPDRNFGVSTNGEYLAGGDYLFSLDVLYGDVDGNGTVNLIDALLQRGRNGTDDIWADINGDGVVNLIDALLLRGRNGTTLS